jgi:hypothetical protein
MSERFKAPSRVGQGHGACRANDLGQTNPSEIWPAPARRLESVARLSVEKSRYFSCCLQRGLFCYPLRLHARARSQIAGPSKSGRFWRNEPDGHPSRTGCKLGRTNPSRLGGGQRAGRTSLGRDSARMVISAIIEGLRHNDFRHFPQTKPISANEANGEKPKETMLQDEQHAPLRSGARACYVPVRGRRDLLFVNPSKWITKGSL